MFLSSWFKRHYMQMLLAMCATDLLCFFPCFSLPLFAPPGDRVQPASVALLPLCVEDNRRGLHQRGDQSDGWGAAGRDQPAHAGETHYSHRFCRHQGENHQPGLVIVGSHVGKKKLWKSHNFNRVYLTFESGIGTWSG